MKFVRISIYLPPFFNPLDSLGTISLNPVKLDVRARQYATD
jgi:hypothetical protein